MPAVTEPLPGEDACTLGVICGQFYNPAKVAGDPPYCGRSPHSDETPHKDLVLGFEWWG